MGVEQASKPVSNASLLSVNNLKQNTKKNVVAIVPLTVMWSNDHGLVSSRCWCSSFAVLLSFSHCVQLLLQCTFLNMSTSGEERIASKREEEREKQAIRSFYRGGAYDSSCILDVSWQLCFYFKCVADYSSLFLSKWERQLLRAREKKTQSSESIHGEVKSILLFRYRKLIHHHPNEETRQNVYFFSWRYRCKRENKEDTCTHENWERESEKNCFRIMRGKTREVNVKEWGLLIDSCICVFGIDLEKERKNKHLVCIDMKKEEREKSGAYLRSRRFFCVRVRLSLRQEKSMNEEERTVLPHRQDRMLAEKTRFFWMTRRWRCWKETWRQTEDSSPSDQFERL